MEHMSFHSVSVMSECTSTFRIIDNIVVYHTDMISYYYFLVLMCRISHKYFGFFSPCSEIIDGYVKKKEYMIIW